jgi:hypothetical protein
MLGSVEIARAQLNLAIDIDSEPISGSATWSDGEPRRFSGWIDLAALIEEVRASAAEAKTLGYLPGAKGPGRDYLDGQGSAGA